MIASRWASFARYERVTFPGGYSPYETREKCYFCPETAGKVIEWSEKHFRHWRGELGGQPIRLEEWQRAILATVFGWKRPDGRRRYKVAWVEVPRGNGKSTLCAVIVGVLLFLDNEPGAEIFSAAGSRDQAREVFNPFNYNCLSSPYFSRKTKSYVNSVVHIDPKTGAPLGSYKSISADADTQHGGAPHGVIFDEVHVQKNRNLWDVLETGAAKRRNALIVGITTAGPYDPNSLYHELHTHAERVRDGHPANSFLPVIYAASPDDDWRSPETWRKANPNLNISISEEEVARMCQRAVDTPGFENTFKRLHLNIVTQTEQKWLDMDSWQACGPKEPREQKAWLDRTLSKARGPCVAGLDIGSTSDTTALVLAFVRPSGKVVLLPFFWIPEARVAKRERRDRVPYRDWARDGYVTITEGNETDYDTVERDIDRLGVRYGIEKIAADRLFQGAQLTQRLGKRGYEIVDFGQGFTSMSAPTLTLEQLVNAGRIQHGGNPVLRWMAANCSVQTDDAGNMKPSRKKSTEKIDGIVASVMALGLASVTEFGSVYDHHGVREF